MQLEPVLQLLSDGQFHSGEELGAALGVSRAAVWKQLQKLSHDYVLPIESVKGKGYRLSCPVELLDEASLLSLLDKKTQRLSPRISKHVVVNSTNDWLLDQPPANAHICLAEYQTQGRGRRGKSWQASFGNNIIMSIGWRFNRGASAAEGLSLAVGVAVVTALSRFGIDGLSLKWPNDILHEGKKLCGILIEMSGDIAGDCYVVVGIGLNYFVNADTADKIDQQHTDVYSLYQSCQNNNACVDNAKSQLSRHTVTAAVIDEVVALLSTYEQQMFTYYRDTWQQLDAFAGQDVVLHMGEQCVVGVGQGVNEQGHFVVLTGSGKQVLSGGEVSLRKK